jgi:hypothetical protein
MKECLRWFCLFSSDALLSYLTRNRLAFNVQADWSFLSFICVETIMTTVNQSASTPVATSVLRKVLLLDAATCVAMGLLLTLAARFLSALLGLPESFIFWAGIALFPCAALMALAGRVGSDISPPAWLVWVVILGNLGWVIASALTITLWFSPTTIGIAFVLIQAIAVAGLAGLEYYGLKNS